MNSILANSSQVGEWYASPLVFLRENGGTFDKNTFIP